MFIFGSGVDVRLGQDSRQALSKSPARAKAGIWLATVSLGNQKKHVIPSESRWVSGVRLWIFPSDICLK